MTDEHDPLDARTRILDAAEHAFAESGQAGARVAAIAEDAAVNKAMLYYYFGSKESLYEAVLERITGEFIALAERVGANLDGPPDEGVVAFVDGYRAILTGHPYFVRLALRGMLDDPTAFQAWMAPQILKVLAQVAALVGRGQAEGTFSTDVEPRLVPPMLVAPMAFFALVQPILAQVSGLPPEALSTLWRDQAVALYLDGLRARPKESP